MFQVHCKFYFFWHFTDGRLTSSQSLTIHTDNSPPTVTITSPPDLYAFGSEVVTLQAQATDIETPNSLSYQWVIDMIHNNHRHPQVFMSSGPTVQLQLSGMVSPTERNSLEIFMYVMDGGNVTGTAMVRAYPVGMVNS